MATEYSKRCLIDWLSITTTKFDVKKSTHDNVFYINENEYLLGFLNLFDIYKMPQILPSGKNGYQNMILIGEHIKILFGSNFIKDSSGNYVSQILLTGAACREFENHYECGWKRFLEFVSELGDVKRIDIAIDDFKASEIEIYEIESLMRKGYYTSKFNYRNFNISERTKNFETYLDGFTITLGKRPGNQLCIYDKRKERDAKNEPDLPVSTWYRYEMRLTNEKADIFLKEYLVGLTDNDSQSFMKLASSLLVEFLDLKDPKSKDKNKARMQRYSKWQNFLGSIEKIDLRTKYKIDTTIKSQKDWFNYSISQMFASFYLSDTDFSFFEEMSIFEGLYKILKNNDLKRLAMINNHRVENNLEKLTMYDVRDEFYKLSDKNKFLLKLDLKDELLKEIPKSKLSLIKNVIKILESEIIEDGDNK